MAEEKKKVKMATAKKRDLQNAKRRKNNASFKSKLKTTLRFYKKGKTEKAASPVASSASSLDDVYSILDKSVKLGIFKQNKADRLKGRLAKSQAK